MSEKWTKGPWSYWSPETDNGKWQIDCDGGPMLPRRKIATVHTREMGSEANARLIAAAPDLYEALSKLLARHDRPHGFDDAEWYRDVVEPARAAIAKARGDCGSAARAGGGR